MALSYENIASISTNNKEDKHKVSKALSSVCAWLARNETEKSNYTMANHYLDDCEKYIQIYKDTMNNNAA